MSNVEVFQEHVRQAGESVSDPAFYRSTVERFHALYYDSPGRTWLNTYWLGTPIAKCPLDLWIYQELFYELRPDVVIECGTFHGGSALFLASLCDLMDHGRIYTIDIAERDHLPVHPRIEYLRGSSLSEEVIDYLRKGIAPNESVLVILDSDHSKSHVVDELQAYSPFVTLGSYLILEDTNVNGHPAFPSHGPGPMEALEEFLESHGEFEVDAGREKFFLTFNPRGYLRRIASEGMLHELSEPVRTSPFSNPEINANERSHFAYDHAVDKGRDTPLSRALRLVGQNKRVLELGCAIGQFSKALVEQGCQVVGVEGNELAAEQAASACQRVIVADLEEPGWESALGEERFDVIVAGDVLEHLRDPDACLRRLRRFLLPDGYVVASIPNIAHGSIRLALLAGTFEYREAGILDRTHLRFFTRPLIEELFDKAGFAIETIEGLEAPIDGTAVKLRESQLPQGLIDWLETDESARTFQFLVVARPLRHGTERALRKRVQALVSENEELRREIQNFTRPQQLNEGGEELDERTGRRFLELQARILDLDRQLSRRGIMLEQVQSELLALMGEAEPMRRTEEDHEKVTERLNDFIKAHTEESSRYVDSLHGELSKASDALEQKDKQIFALNDFIKVHMEESKRYVDSLLYRIQEREAALLSMQQTLQDERVARASEPAQLDQARQELRRVHESKLWKIGSLYWRILGKLGLT